MSKVFLHRYKYSHDKKRAKYRKLLRMGKVKIIEQNKDGWLYEEIKV
jgi:hypothetical protein